VTEQKVVLEAILASVNSQTLLEILFKKVKKEGMEVKNIIELFQEVNNEISIPISLFSSSLNPMEAICKHLIEYERCSKNKVATLLGRSVKTIWANYERAKYKKILLMGNERYTIPISFFHNRSLSIMEHVVSYLIKTHQLSTKGISQLLGKSMNSIAVLAKRAKVKNES
jgi:hypothetical protein